MSGPLDGLSQQWAGRLGIQVNALAPGHMTGSPLAVDGGMSGH